RGTHNRVILGAAVKPGPGTAARLTRSTAQVEVPSEGHAGRDLRPWQWRGLRRPGRPTPGGRSPGSTPWARAAAGRRARRTHVPEAVRPGRAPSTWRATRS